MKKFLHVLKALCVTTVLGVACFALTSCEKKDAAHTITFYTTMGDKLQEPLNKAIDKFEEKFPGWTVEAVFPGGYDEVRSAIVGDLQANSQPDLAYCYADHVAQYLTSGKVVNMSNLINSTDALKVSVKQGEEWSEKTYDEIVGYTAEEIADFVPGYYAEGYAENYANYSSYGFGAKDVLTLPFQKSTEILYYNADALEELEAEVPQTWDELWEICTLAKEKWPECTPLGYDSESNWFITMCQQNGWGYTSASSDNHYLFYNENTVAWLEELRGHFQNKLFTTQEIYGAYSSNLFVKGIEEGGTLFSIGSSGGASYQNPAGKFNWGVAPVPGSVVGEDEYGDPVINNSAISQGPSLVMFQTSAENSAEKQILTWEFVKILLDPEYQCKFAGTSGYMPARLSSYEVDYYKELLKDDSDIVVATVLCAKGMADRYYTSPAFVGSSTARTQVGSALVYATMGTKTADAALRDAAKKCGAKLD